MILSNSTIKKKHIFSSTKKTMEAAANVTGVCATSQVWNFQRDDQGARPRFSMTEYSKRSKFRHVNKPLWPMVLA